MFLLSFYLGNELKIAAIPIEQRVKVGRDKGCTVLLMDPSVSRRHATFFVQKMGNETCVMLHDEGSTNGCEVNGEKVVGRIVQVRPEDRIKIGRFRVKLQEQKNLEFPSEVDDFEQSIVYQGPPVCSESLPTDRLQALYNFNCEVSRLNVEQLLDLAAKTVASCLHYDVFCVFLRGEKDSPTLRTWTSSGSCCPASKVAINRVLLEKSLTQNVVIIADKNPGSAPRSQDRAVGQSPCSTLCVPLISGQQSIGAIYMASEAPAIIYAKEELQFLILVANQVASNVSSRKAFQDMHAEGKRFEAIVSSLDEGIVVIDTHPSVVFANKAAQDMLGKRDLAGKPLEDVLKDCRHTLANRALSGGMRFELETPRGDGRDELRCRTLAVTVSENQGQDGEDWQYILCLRDVSDSALDERKKSSFVSSITNDLKGPLAFIAQVHGLLLQEGVVFRDPEHKDLIAESLQCLETCARLREHLGEYGLMSWIENPLLDPRSQCLVERLIDSALETNRALISRKDLSVGKHIGKDARAVHGDEEKLHFALDHIVRNAALFGDKAGVLTINACLFNKMVKIQFLDDGPGIAAGKRAELFQMLEEKGEPPATGLGLWIAREIIQAHRGEIKISSPINETGGGTLVEILLPPAPDVKPRADERTAIKTAVLRTG